MTVYLLPPDFLWFPDPLVSGEESLVAVGGDLKSDRLLLAYRSGIFPWFSEDDPILWHSPDPRFVLFPDQFKLRRSLKKIIKNQVFEIRFDQAFEEVLRACSESYRPGQDGTWITNEIIEAYLTLHREGHAHSIETWREGRLVGGLYGIAMGPFFFGESMFYRESNASKVALAALVNMYRDAPFIDCQVASEFFSEMGACNIPRTEFMACLKKHIDQPSLWNPQAT